MLTLNYYLIILLKVYLLTIRQNCLVSKNKIDTFQVHSFFFNVSQTCKNKHWIRISDNVIFRVIFSMTCGLLFLSVCLRLCTLLLVGLCNVNILHKYLLNMQEVLHRVQGSYSAVLKVYQNVMQVCHSGEFTLV